MILLTGATGFLGSHLLRSFVARGAAVTVLKRRTSDVARIADLLPRVAVADVEDADFERLMARGVSTVVHCATNYGRSGADPLEVVEANIVLPLRLLHAGLRTGVRTFVNTDTILDKRVSHYSLSKSQFTQWLAQHGHSMRCLNVSLEHFYGPGDDPSKFATFVIRQLLARVPAIELTPGEQVRHFVHIDDVTRAFELLLERSGDWAHGLYQFQVASAAGVTVRRFVELARELSGNRTTELRFGALPYRENEVMEPQLDLRPMAALGWEARIELAEGLARTIDSERGATGR